MLSLLMTTEYAPAEDRHELQQLILRVAGGEREALAELYQRTRSAVYGLALSYLKNAHDAQDITQDVYVQVWDCAEQYRSTGSPNGTPFPRRSADWTPMSAPFCSKRWQALRTRNGVSCCSTRSRV